MISEWRKIWNTFTPTSSSFPFGFMQLGTMGANNPNPSFPVIRWHQTADIGYVPNELMEVNDKSTEVGRAPLIIFNFAFY
jgi:sialate O-acetylesterase